MGKEIELAGGQEVANTVAWANRLAGAEMLPGQYRGRPGNLIWAAEYAKSLNVHPMVAVTGIYVIDGKPCASGALISALVRRAGHKLRVKTTTTHATAQIIRSDDPDFTFEVTWELKANKNGNPSAQDAGLLTKQNWVKYPASLLGWRAITQCAREACEEALMGVHYTVEELDPNRVINEDGHPVHVERMETSSFEDMLAPQIIHAVDMTSLEKLHRDAVLGGILESVPTSEMQAGRMRTILTLLNTRAKEITSAARAESEGAGERQDPEGERQGSAGTGGEQADRAKAEALTPETDYNSELVEAEVME
jgi:hypothetical protein